MMAMIIRFRVLFAVAVEKPIAQAVAAMVPLAAVVAVAVVGCN